MERIAIFIHYLAGRKVSGAVLEGNLMVYPPIFMGYTSTKNQNLSACLRFHGPNPCIISVIFRDSPFYGQNPFFISVIFRDFP